jgi:uncharacterized protein (TIRG00374 family)
VLFGVLLWQLDAKRTLQEIVRAGWMLLPAFGAYMGTLAFSTLAWRQTIDPSASRASYWQLLSAFWAGHAMNKVSPGGVYGEVLKGSILRNDVDPQELVASLVTYNFLTVWAGVAFALAAPPLALGLGFDMPSRVSGTVLAAAAIVLVALGLAHLVARRGLARNTVRLVTKLPFVRSTAPDSWHEKAESIDRRIRHFARQRPGALARAIVYLLIVRALMAFEFWLLLLPMLPDRSPVMLLALALVTQGTMVLVSWAGAFVPGRLGVIEGGAALLFRSLSLDPMMGFAIIVLRRVRRILGIAVGFVLGSVLESRARKRQAAG